MVFFLGENICMSYVLNTFESILSQIAVGARAAAHQIVVLPTNVVFNNIHMCCVSLKKKYK